MVSNRVVLLEADSTQKQSLAMMLRGASGHVQTADSLLELRRQIAADRAEVAVVDMELITMKDVMELSREFPATCIVCHHRLADEEMWTAALNAGATDICNSADPRAIVSAVLHGSHLKGGQAAA